MKNFVEYISIKIISINICFQTIALFMQYNNTQLIPLQNFSDPPSLKNGQVASPSIRINLRIWKPRGNFFQSP